jgi:hypothetical protein
MELHYQTTPPTTDVAVIVTSFLSWGHIIASLNSAKIGPPTDCALAPPQPRGGTTGRQFMTCVLVSDE